jgi:hypothetical protein
MSSNSEWRAPFQALLDELGDPTYRELQRTSAIFRQAFKEVGGKSIPRLRETDPGKRLVLANGFADGVFDHEYLFQYPKGEQKFDEITQSPHYYIYDRNRAFLLHDLPPWNARWMSIGGATGRLDLELWIEMKKQGWDGKLDVILIDMAKSSHELFAANARSFDPDAKIACYDMDCTDFTDKGMYNKEFVEAKIRARDDPKQLYVSKLNLNGQSTAGTVLHTASQMRSNILRPGDVYDDSFECTLNKEAIDQSYGFGRYPKDGPPKPRFDRWFGSGLKHILEVELGVLGVKRKYFEYYREYEPDEYRLPAGSFSGVNFHAGIRIKAGHPVPELHPKLLDILKAPENRKLYERVEERRRKFAGSKFETLFSKRYNPVVARETHMLGGLRIVKVLCEANLPPHRRARLKKINPIILRSGLY